MSKNKWGKRSKRIVLLREAWERSGHLHHFWGAGLVVLTKELKPKGAMWSSSSCICQLRDKILQLDKILLDWVRHWGYKVKLFEWQQGHPTMLIWAHLLAFQAERCDWDTDDQQPHTWSALPPEEGSAPPGPCHVRLLPPVSDLSGHTCCAGGSAAAPDQVWS